MEATAQCSWSSHSNSVSTFDVLQDDVVHERNGSHWSQDKHLVVEGEAAATCSREVSRRSPRTSSIISKTARRRNLNDGERSRNNAEEEDGSRRQLQLENERLQQEVRQWRREVEHVREEKAELETSFRRLDQEIVNGYNLVERKDKELRIAELVTKNQKLSQLLQKELQSHEEVRRAHAELQGEHQKAREQIALLNRVLDSLETKHTELSSSHSALTASYESAQATMETLQSANHALQDKLATSDMHIVSDYEAKIQQWERICRDLEHKCEHVTQELTKTQQLARTLQQEAQGALQYQKRLEQEVRSGHDEITQLSATMRTMEEKDDKTAQYGDSRESLRHRIRQLEEMLQRKTPAKTELIRTRTHLLGAQRRTGAGKTPHAATNNRDVVSRVAKLTTRINFLTGKLQSTEMTCDRTSRSLDILMQAFPFLLHRLDALQDRYVAAVESNDIIKSAIEQMQDPQDESSDCINGAMYLQLARDKYLLEAPYPMDLLAEQIGAQVLSGNLESIAALTGRTTKKKVPKFSPFRVTCSAFVPIDNEYEDESDGQLVLLAADLNDGSGATYLNRSKINAFLEVIQSTTARKKFKRLVIGKLAELLHKLREVIYRAASEGAAQQALIQMLQREVVELQQRLKKPPSSDNEYQGRPSESRDACKARCFLLKLLDVYLEKQQMLDECQMTFLTQPRSREMLQTQSSHCESFADCLCLANSRLEDDDVEQLLVNIMTNGVQFRAINLDLNDISDLGAQHVASFVEKAPTSVQVVSLVGNKRITLCGIEAIKQGLRRNQRVQRVKEDEDKCQDRLVLQGLAGTFDVDVDGNASEVLSVVVPNTSVYEGGEARSQSTTSEAVDAMTEKLQQLGFRSNIRPLSATPRLQSTVYRTKKRVVKPQSHAHPRSLTSFTAIRSNLRPSSIGINNMGKTRPSSDVNNRRRAASSGVMNGTSRDQRRQIKQQQEARFQSLEAAIQRAYTPTVHRQGSTSVAHSMLKSRLSVNRESNKQTFTRVDAIRGLRRS